MTETPGRRRAVTALLAVAALAGISFSHSAEHADEQARLAVAEEFVSAFYSFDAKPLGALLAAAGESRRDMLFYQGWAKGGNYIVVERMPCAAFGDDAVRCSITVQDDLVLSLGIDFDVTDTFTLTFDGDEIRAVETSSNDPQLYHDARDWVWAHRRDWVERPCRGGGDTAPDPVQCVHNMLKGYRDYARLEGLTPRVAR